MMRAMKWALLAITTAAAQNMPSEAPHGRMVFEDGAPASGRHTLVANQAGRSSAPLEVALPAGEAREDLLLLLSARARLRGRVSGLPKDRLAGVEVFASGPGLFLAATRTGADGRFKLTGLPEGRLDLRATVGDAGGGALRTAATQILIAAGQIEAEVELVFEARYTLAGTVTRAGELGHELVALPVHGDDEARLLRVGLDFLAQPGDVHVDGAEAWHRVHSPDRVEQLVARERDARVAHEVAEQAKLLRRKPQRHAVTPHLGGAQVHLDAGEAV